MILKYDSDVMKFFIQLSLIMLSSCYQIYFVALFSIITVNVTTVNVTTITLLSTLVEICKMVSYNDPLNFDIVFNRGLDRVSWEKLLYHPSFQEYGILENFQKKYSAYSFANPGFLMKCKDFFVMLGTQFLMRQFPTNPKLFTAISFAINFLYHYLPSPNILYNRDQYFADGDYIKNSIIDTIRDEFLMYYIRHTTILNAKRIEEYQPFAIAIVMMRIVLNTIPKPVFQLLGALPIVAVKTIVNIPSYLLSFISSSISNLFDEKKHFLAAVASNDVQTVLEALADDPDCIHAVDDQGNTAFLIAVLKGYMEIVFHLKDHGAELDNYFKDGTPVLLYAIEQKDYAMFSALLRLGMDPNIQYNGHSLLSVLMLLGEDQAIEELIQYEAYQTVVEMESMNIVYYAIDNNKHNLLRLLLEHSYDPNYYSAKVAPALHYAIGKHNKEAIAILLQHGARLDIKYNGHTGTELAENEHDPSLLLNSQPSSNNEDVTDHYGISSILETVWEQITDWEAATDASH